MEKACILCDMKYGIEDPIAALATPPGQSAIAIIRLSGKGTLSLLAPLFEGAVSPETAPGHTLHYGILRDPETGEHLDQVVLGIYQGPASYTGEDSAEVFCHGSMTIVKKILMLLERHGFRQAQPGEFTLRGFMNKKMDLTRAEAVNEIIRARSDKARALALHRLSGAIEDSINLIKEEVVNIQAAIEIRLDYPDEDIDEAFDVSPQMARIKEDMNRLLSTYKTGKVIQEGITIVIAGGTNAGKSTLFNLLLREDRAIVSDIHGTTRDYIEGAITIEGIPVRLFDTAGIRKTDHPVEQEGIRRTDKMMENADILMYIVDASRGVQDEDRAYISTLGEEEKTLLLWNKTDISDKDIPGGFLPISAVTGSGLDALHEEIVRHILGKTALSSGGPVIDSERQKNLLTHGLAAMEEFEAGLARSMPLDVLATCIQDTLEDLGQITGEVTTAGMLEVMFSQFCVGK